jgi:hypothetical protein
MLTGNTLQQHGIMPLLDPNDAGNVSLGNSLSYVFTVNDANSANQLLSYLTYLGSYNFRNFFFFGHGSNRQIGAYNGAGLTQDQIAYALINVPLSYQYATVFFGNPFFIPSYPMVVPVQLPTTVQTAALHPYRFVYIDACDTGAGNFCEAFGIPSVTLSMNDFAAASRESRVFVGYKSWKIANVTQFNWENYSSLMWYFLYAWTTSGLTAQQCVNDAKQNNWPSPPMPSTRASTSMDSSVVIYGAADMNAFTHTGQ